MTSNTTRRRWFQFGLRTMFVAVAVFAVWLGWELRFVQQRREAVRSMRSEDYYWESDDSKDLFPLMASQVQKSKKVTIPRWRRWIGDEAMLCIIVSPKAGPTEVEMRRMFPEAFISSY
jgi:hypothetical protein